MIVTQNLAITNGPRAKALLSCESPVLLTESGCWTLRLWETGLQNLGDGIEGLPFGLSQQIGVTKRRAGKAAREECGTKSIKVTTQTHESPKPTSGKSLENKDTN